MSDLTRLSAALDTSERTLRRAANTGLAHADRVSERRVYVPDAERRYLTRHWSLLSGLRSALRTEPNIRLAVLFGSTARGDGAPDSDIDVLVDLRSPGRFQMMAIEDRLAAALGRHVQLVRLSDAQRDGVFLSEVIGDGRVLADREGRWRGLSAARHALQIEAEEDFAARAHTALARARRPSPD